MSGESTHDQQEALVPSDLDREMAQDFFFMEKSRTDAERERTQLGFKAIEAQDASGQRVHEFQMAQLEKGFEDRRNRYKSVIRIIWAVLVFGMVGAGVLLSLLFAGNESQQAIAFELLKLLGAAIAGGGFISLVGYGLRKASSML